mmetsp:Transcript_1323/g.981  ORF Transcript_1323/g.981 Transcript_1323/m.981 type:complete len:100 (-) Transcript_1323:86-385(-)
MQASGPGAPSRGRPQPAKKGFLGSLRDRFMGFAQGAWSVLQLFFGSIINPEQPAAVTGASSAGSNSSGTVNRTNPGHSSNTQFGNDDSANDFLRRGRIR